VFPANFIDPFTDGELPNIISRWALDSGKRSSLVFCSMVGRTPVHVVAAGDQLIVSPVRNGARYFGLKAASPSRIGGDRHEDFTFGTSVATALATRAADKIYDVLLDSDGGSNHADLPEAYAALAAKALLVHGAAWGPKGELLGANFLPQGTGSHFARRDVACLYPPKPSAPSPAHRSSIS
jgi:hypothetical protein